MKNIQIKKIIAVSFALVMLSGIAVADTAEFETCRKKLITAQKLEVLYDLAWNGKKSPKVVAGKTFFTMPIDAKEGFAETVNCFLMAGERDKFINFEILHWQTGKAVGSFSYGRYKHY